MTEKELLIWAAGVVDGRGIIATTVEQGKRKMFPAITLLVPLSHEQQYDRMLEIAGNGSRVNNSDYYELGGYGAVKGFMAELWPYLTPSKRSEINAELRKFKALKLELKNRAS